jgi:Xaa-Pro aminopeptidase
VAATTAGATNAEVVAACGEQYVLSSLGHGAGVNPWEPPHFSVTSKNDPLKLRAGMVANYEPYYGKPGVAGFRLEHNLVIREGGPEIYTTYPFDARLLRNVHPLDPSTGRVIRRG